MGPGFESLKVHQEKRDAFLHLFFLATFVGGELLVRPIAKQWHEERSDEVVPESAHTPQGVYFVPALSVRPAEGAAANKTAACPFKRTRPLSPRNFFCHANSSRRSKMVGEGRVQAVFARVCERFMMLSYSVENGDRTHRTFRLNLPFPVNGFHFFHSRFCISWIGEVLLVCVL